MEFDEIFQKLSSLNIPVAYLKFNKPQQLPFMVYFESSADIQGADTYNLYRQVQITVELYTAQKSPSLERRLENLFRDRPLTKTADAFLDDEKMFVTSYIFEVIQYMDDTFGIEL